MKKYLKPKSPLADSSPASKVSKAGQKQQQPGKLDSPKDSPGKAAATAAPEEAKQGQEEAPATAKSDKDSSHSSGGGRPSSGTPKKGKGHKGKS